MSSTTIVALATASGRSGVNIIRMSGSASYQIALKVSHKTKLNPRHAYFSKFYSATDEVIDSGLMLYFKAPHSFTGEDIIEIHCHGGNIISDWIIEEIVNLGATQAIGGEFSQRAFTNNKLDLTQAEAISDLIDSSSRQAARAASRSLSGDFAKHIHQILEKLTHTRVYVEAAIDFTDEDIDFLADDKLLTNLQAATQLITTSLTQARQSSLIQEGVKIAILGLPNAGKSSLLNTLIGDEIAIVTDTAGTTRDLINASFNLDGLKITLVDTAGLHHTDDKVEKIGIERAWQAAATADIILLVIDVSTNLSLEQHPLYQPLHAKELTKKLITSYSKADLITATDHKRQNSFSSTTGQGIENLKDVIKKHLGFSDVSEDICSIRRRHVHALTKVQEYIKAATAQIQDAQPDLAAADLMLAQQQLGTITGTFTSDDLLGEIFGNFCIGK